MGLEVLEKACIRQYLEEKVLFKAHSKVTRSTHTLTKLLFTVKGIAVVAPWRRSNIDTTQNGPVHSLHNLTQHTIMLREGIRVDYMSRRKLLVVVFEYIL